MRTFRVALAQMNATVGDLQGNVAKMLSFIEQARAQGADLIAFPELAVTGYPPEDLLFKPSFLHDNVAAMEQVVAKTQGMGAVIGFAHPAHGDLFNAAAVAWDGKLVDVYHKMYLPNYGVFDEDRYFRPGNACPVYVINGVKVGVNICEDIWYATGPTALQRDAGAEVIININGSPYHAGKGLARTRMIATRAADNQLCVAYVNMAGGQDELVFDGHSLVCDPSGTVVRHGGQFTEDLIVHDLDISAVERARLKSPLSRKEPVVLDSITAPKIIHVSDYKERTKPTLKQPSPALLDPDGEVYHALVAGTRDYVRKTGFKRVLLGISGGIDSSLVASIAVDALGPENVLGVAMPSRYSSEGSVVDARALAKNLGIEMWTVPIEPGHRAFLEMLDPKFAGTEANVAEENIQSRIRGNLLMAISNKFGWLVLATGNKSEMATGYATLYGDMSGGYAVIKDVFKTMVYRLARWRNVHGEPKAPIPVEVINKPASAELRPGQRTEEALLPFAVLDPVLKAYVEDDQGYEEIVKQGYDVDVVKRVIRLVDVNEYKRRQAPPGVKITARAFGRDRRMPIINRYRQW